MSFALDVKKELLTNEYSPPVIKELISGIIATSVLQKNNDTLLSENWKINISNHEISHLIIEMLIKANISHENNGNFITVHDFAYQDNLHHIKKIFAYFCGAFIGGGSISKLSVSSYHLEIQLHSRKKATELMQFLKYHSFHFNLIQRRKMWVIYLKKSDQISDFLKSIHAFNSLLKFEDERIKRDYNNHINRYSNLDTYNLQKIAQSNVAFEEMHDEIKKHNLLNLFNQKELNFFNLKLKNQYISLQELTDLYNKKYSKKITKSGLNHYLIKLKKTFHKIS